MSLIHRPARTQPTAHSLHQGFVARLGRGGQPLVSRPLQELLPRPRRRRPIRLWQVAEVTGRALEALLGTGLSIAATLAVDAPLVHGLRWF
jgi:hypothetical protein